MKPEKAKKPSKNQKNFQQVTDETGSGGSVQV
jgi:hypothetical protein